MGGGRSSWPSRRCWSRPSSCSASSWTTARPNRDTEPHPITEWQLASRLSYFLWRSMPDDELFDLAAKGQLSKNLDAQVRRMLADPRSRALVENFAMQWLQLRNAQELHARPQAVPAVRRVAAVGDAQGDGAVLRGDHPRGPQHPRPDRRRLHLPQRTAGPALRHRRHQRQPGRPEAGTVARSADPRAGVHAGRHCNRATAAAS